MKPETEDIKKFRMALDRRNRVLVKLLIAYSETVHSGPVGKPRCMVFASVVLGFFMLPVINLTSSREATRAGAVGVTLYYS